MQVDKEEQIMFKDKLKELREKNNISQYQLAEKIYVSRSAIAKWESGLGMPSADSLEMLCKFFDVTKEELLEENDPSIVINNVQKKSKKIIILLSIIVGILLFATCASLLETIIQFKIDEEYAYHRNEFYNDIYVNLKNFLIAVSLMIMAALPFVFDLLVNKKEDTPPQ